MTELKEIATEILLEQLQYIKKIPAEDRKIQEAKFVLEIWKACEEETYHERIVDLTHIPDEDLENIARKRHKYNGE